MGIQTTIFNTIKEQLSLDENLRTYIDGIYEGFRKGGDAYIPKAARNYIVMEVMSAIEDYPNGGDAVVGIQKSLTMNIAVLGVITVIDKDNTDANGGALTTIDNQIGLLNMDEDIKNAIDNNVEIQKLGYSINATTRNFLFEDFPWRKTHIEIIIKRNFTKGQR